MPNKTDSSQSVFASKEPLPASAQGWRTIVIKILTPVASMKLTVALFLLAIFIVLAGTLAQTEKDIWQVIQDYFRMDLRSVSAALHSAFAWIDFRIFFPTPFFPHMEPIPEGIGFWFPSGWLIGLVLFINLSAAQTISYPVLGRGGQRALGLGIVAIGIALTAGVILAGSRQTASQLTLFADWPSLRILWLLTQCTVVSVVLLVGFALLYHKKAGIALLHAGVGLLMLGELLVGIAAVEGQMQIIEGQTVNCVLDTRELELAVIDSSGETEDDVVAIPQSLLKPGKKISEKHLAFDIELVKYIVNARCRPVTKDDQNPATAGTGLETFAQPVKPLSGADDSGLINRAAAYVKFSEKGAGRPLGVYLISFEQWMTGQKEKVRIGGKQYEVTLRYKHMYKPYSMHLVDVQQDVYMGTQTAKSYSSKLRLVDPTRNVDRPVKIWMNNPLRFAGETFYQSRYGRDQRTGNEYTELQVVTNTGWRIPYVSCMMVAVGMLAQFWLILPRFLRGRGTDEAHITPPAGGPARSAGGPPSQKGQASRGSSNALDWAVPLAVVTVCGLWLLSRAYEPAPQKTEYDISAFGRLPVMYEGRVKPFDTLARNSLRILSNKQTFKDEDDNKHPAVKWLLDVITDSDAAGGHRVFRIDHPQVLEVLGLKARKHYRYALDEFRENLETFDEQAHLARAPEADEADVYGKKILELERKLHLYMMLREAFRLPQLRADKLNEDLAREMSRREQYARYTMPLAIPPTVKDEPWQAFTHAVFDALAQRMIGRKANSATVGFTQILQSYEDREVPSFNRSVDEYRAQLAQDRPAQWNESKTDFEASFNHFAPLYNAMILYVVAFVLVCLSWLGWGKRLNRAAFWLTLFTLIVHTVGLLARMYISGRPPITNLYSSAIFVGWGCAISGLIFERVYKIGVGNAVAALLGFGGLLVAFLLTTAVPSFKGDSFTVLVAVLDTQFWLATHVLCITAGYSATFVAGFFGIAYVLRGVLTPSLTPEVGKVIGRMTYGTLCFALFFSFVGTVLGGLWADDSWGRFWGWDPKENGALIIVLWNALVLHALGARMIRERGLAVLAILGNVVTAWSWFGVNELRVGLHSYGFTQGVLLILALFVASQLLIALVGLIPKQLWWSNQLHDT